MKAFLFKLFISRAAPIVVQYLGKTIQNGAVAASVALGAHGVNTGDNLTLIAAGVSGLIAVGVDFARSHYGDAVVAAVAK